MPDHQASRPVSGTRDTVAVMPPPANSTTSTLAERDRARYEAALSEAEPLLLSLLLAVRRGDPLAVERLADMLQRAAGLLWETAGHVNDPSR